MDGARQPDQELNTHPAARDLIEAAIAAIETAIPDQFEHGGRTYFLRSMIRLVDLGIHADPAKATPLLRMVTESKRWCGFRPGH
ncbi:MAG: hypothetical protein RBR52_07130 [Thiomonas sp.]|uniref:hypothetical protein n=1 Tax=Thiomonas sp. TaxID=2047785 RepID=UPI002A36DA40|nr:hypothetical protein [Thiomonas sp.]MDY0330251.1 hypothetical protein [Thiomonas sp.]